MGGGKKSAGRRGANEANKMAQLGIDKLDPFAQAGAGQLDGLTEGATIGGLDARLAEIFNSDTFSALIGDRTRGVQGQLAAGGLTRSGAGMESIANVGSELGLQLEQLLTGRSQGLAGQGLQAAGGVADMLTQQGQNTASGIVTDAQSKAAGLGGVAKLASGIFFSDERLKTNIVHIGDIGKLPLYEWDWIPQAEGTIIVDCPRVGFMAGEVQEIYPHLVGEAAGWKFVDYTAVLGELQSDLDDKIMREAA
jgi:hypothetical protein